MLKRFKSKFNNIDYPLLFSVIGLILIGIFILAGISADYSLAKFGESTYFLFHQIIWGFIPGIVLGFIVFLLPLSFFKKMAWPFLLFSLAAMTLVFIPGLRVTISGASRWINLGPLGTFQPSELLKLAVIIYLSALLAKRVKKKDNWKVTLVPFVFALLIIIAILNFQSDASTLILIAAVASLIYFVSDMPFWHIIIVIFLGLGACLPIFFEPYRLNRIKVFLGIIKEPLKAGYQIEQAKITIGSGGLFGLGPGMSNQKIGGLLPQPISDSIFAIFCEEMGFVWCFILISLFLFLLWRSFRIFKKSKDKFSQFFAVGVGSWICLQAFFNIAAIIGLMPVTGIPLPFVSYGGSHIMVELIAMGLLLNVSKSVEK